MDCTFCQIVNGAIPSAIILEDEEFIAILDIAPIQRGHTLVIPKRHFELYTDLPEELARRMGAFVHRIAEAVVAGTGAEGFNILSNSGKCAGQAVPICMFT